MDHEMVSQNSTARTETEETRGGNSPNQRSVDVPEARQEINEFQIENDECKYILNLTYQLKSATFICYFFMILAQFVSCEAAFKELQASVPSAFIFTIMNLSYYLIEAVYYLTIALEKNNKSLQYFANFVQTISVSFVIIGIVIIDSELFKKFEELSKNDKNMRELVRVFSQMIELRFYYILLLGCAKVMWFLAPYIERLSGLEQFRDKPKIDLVQDIRNQAKTYESKCCQNETCPICLQDFVAEVDIIVELECSSKHVFHLECLSTWVQMQQQNNDPENPVQCPMCRKAIEIRNDQAKN